MNAPRRKKNKRKLHPCSSVVLSFRFYLERHNEYVERIAKSLHGETYKTAPFDIATKNVQFYEVKVAQRRHRRGSVRMSISKDELKFMNLMKEAYHFVLVVLGEPVTISTISYEQMHKWESVRAIQRDFTGRQVKLIEFSKKRLSSLTPMEV